MKFIKGVLFALLAGASIGGIVLLFILSPLVFKWLWNWLIVGKWALLPEITFWQSLALLTMGRLLTGGTLFNVKVSKS